MSYVSAAFPLLLWRLKQLSLEKLGTVVGGMCWAMDLDALLTLASYLATLPDSKSFLLAVREELLRIAPADEVFWMVTDLTARNSVVRHGAGWTVNEQLGALMGRHGETHPAIRSYLTQNSDQSPRRVSDVASAGKWRDSGAHRAMKDLMAEHQLSVIVDFAPPMRGRGWVLCREGRDFSDAELDRTRLLFPLLVAVGRMYDRLEPWHNPAASAVGGLLTARELAVLTLLARGLSVDAIGRRLAISGRTVAKHLEHVYRKLGCNDRLVAVTLAKELGILAEPVLPTHPPDSESGRTHRGM